VAMLKGLNALFAPLHTSVVPFEISPLLPPSNFDSGHSSSKSKHSLSG